MFKFIKEVNGVAIFSFLLAAFCFLIPFIDNYVPYPFPRQIFYALLDYGGPQVALISGIIALIWIKKTRQKGKWLAILAIILGGIASTFVSL